MRTLMAMLQNSKTVGKDEKSSARRMFTLTIRMESAIRIFAVKKISRRIVGIGTIIIRMNATSAIGRIKARIKGPKPFCCFMDTASVTDLLHLSELRRFSWFLAPFGAGQPTLHPLPTHQSNMRAIGYN